MHPKPIRKTRVAKCSCLAACLAGSLVVVGLSPAAPAGAMEVEPLVIRVQDAVGAPGEQTAIVFRTYASRPVRRGRTFTVITPAFALGEGVASPIQSYDEGYIFSVGGVIVPIVDFIPGAQSLDADFESLSATINAQDGVFGVFYVTLDTTLTPGAQYTIALDLGFSFLNDPEDDPVLLETRAGTLTIRAPTAPVRLSAEGGKVQPGSGAVIEIGTEEPFALQEGRIVLTYDPAIATELPVVTADPRHGEVNLIVTYPQTGKIQIDFDSPLLENFNGVPGDLLIMHFGTRPDIPPGTFSPITIVAGESFLVAPGSIPLDVAWGQQAIEFILDPGIFNDGFDTGDTWVWSYQP